MGIKLANNAISRLSGNITNSATTITLISGDGAKFPSLAAGDFFPLTLVKASGDLEIVRATARSGDTITVQRAQEGTAAQAFLAGNGSSTFNLPDLRGEFIRGWADGRAVDTGRAFGSAQTDDFKSHQHNQQHNGTGTQSTQMPSGGGTLGTTTSVVLTTATGGAETRPRNVALLACIKT